MRLALLSLNYPPDNNEGIPRQRKMLAEACAALGHTVHVFTLGPWSACHQENGVHVHRVAVSPTLYRVPGTNPRMLESAALYDALQRVHARVPFDVVDAPVWCGVGWAAIERNQIPVVLNLQTTAAQIIAINGQSSPALEEARELEGRCATRAAGILADSQSALNATRSAYGLPEDVPTACVYHGMPDLHGLPPSRPPSTHLELIVIGRLEKRKGTPDLFKALPAVLAAVPEWTVRLVGGDNSRWDGWEQEHGMSYAAYFQRAHPEWCDRVLFEGYVPEDRMDALRAGAALAVVPSLYESFGFTYIEAIRAGLPLVAFANEATRELFPDGATQGACLVPLQDAPALAEALIRLARDPDARAALGGAGRRRYLEAFQDHHMATGSLRLYHEVIPSWRKRQTRPAAEPMDVHQVMEGLQSGDGVSQIAVTLGSLLRAAGQPDAILTRQTDPGLAVPTAPYIRVLDGKPHALLFHYWNYNHSEWLWHHVPGRKALYFHNITPPRFFPAGSAQAALCRRGVEQLKAWIQRTDVLVGHSAYTLQSIKDQVIRPVPQYVLYPPVDREELLQKPCDSRLLADLQDMAAVHWLFVGRMARNKRPDQLMRWFNAFAQTTDRPAHLWLVGDDAQDAAYREELATCQAALPACARIHFTGKVDDAALMAYYRAATLFVSASEHEGFGIPLAQAMCFGVPVAARPYAAVPETMGPDGCLIPDADPDTVAAYLKPLCLDPERRDEVITAQYKNVQRFSRETVARSLGALLDFLREGLPLPGQSTCSADA